MYYLKLSVLQESKWAKLGFLWRVSQAKVKVLTWLGFCLEALGPKIRFRDLSGRWQNSVPCESGAEVPIFV